MWHFFLFQLQIYLIEENKIIFTICKSEIDETKK